MRIVGGRFKGRTLKAPRSQAIRPTPDRTREGLFNILAHGYPTALEGRRVLELFAGTGAVGFEALSRGAQYALFIEQSAEGRGLLRSNMETLGVQGQSRIFRRDATALGKIGNLEPFDFVFADPPYGKGLGERALASAAAGGWLRHKALAIIEERGDVDPGLVEGFQFAEKRDFGGTVMHFFRFKDAFKAD